MHTNNSIKNQQERLLIALIKAGNAGVSTIECRHVLDVMCPAPRIMELRRRGYNIKTTWSVERTPEGHKHRVGRYLLISINNHLNEAHSYA